MINKTNDKLRSLTYSLDILSPGFYFWWGNFVLQMGGGEVDDDPYYPFVVPTFIGFGFVLPNYLSWHTPFDNFKKVTQTIEDNSNDISKEFGSARAAK